ncbi:hypothetical protein CC1G_11051 [Coprinopsis cinerea okayama7|uniref:Uncharacterized protein n=1 Tax=Coprinopsis cinerea (strain Okayama-7 / 130 / ATCC MYA-4618 / FGSC 9003) TaxID=240176 RepID=A8NIV3_COPC7|nr:hypothetical protein CC1G_11051 [Coprinopsis cinerea okayama7\|eukprot:XP_001834081.2 hypothetical protein CC1G_11051 [Coprinopsis cinerea okayama7\
MAPSRKYETEEDKRQANCQKSRRYYDANKDDINARRRESYARNKKRRQPKVTGTHTTLREPNRARTARNYRLLQLECKLEEAERLFLQWQLRIGPDSHTFLEKICQDFVRLRDSDDPSYVAKRVARLLEDFEHFQDRLEGIAREVSLIEGGEATVKSVQSYSKPIVDLILDLEDLRDRMQQSPSRFCREISKGLLQHQGR